MLGTIHSTKISGNFSPKPNGSVRSNRKGFEKTGPPFKVDHFCRLGWSDRQKLAASVRLPVQFCDITVPMLENLLSHESQAWQVSFWCIYLLLFAKKIQVSQSVFASRLRLFPPKPIRTKMLTFQPPTLLF